MADATGVEGSSGGTTNPSATDVEDIGDFEGMHGRTQHTPFQEEIIGLNISESKRSVGERYGQLETRLDSFRSRLEEVQERRLRHESEIKDLRGQNVQFESRLDSHEDLIEEINLRGKENSSEIRDIIGWQSEVEERITEIEENVSKEISTNIDRDLHAPLTLGFGFAFVIAGLASILTGWILLGIPILALGGFGLIAFNKIKNRTEITIRETI
jgi:hypothetical protein